MDTEWNGPGYVRPGYSSRKMLSALAEALDAHEIDEEAVGEAEVDGIVDAVTIQGVGLQQARLKNPKTGEIRFPPGLLLGYQGQHPVVYRVHPDGKLTVAKVHTYSNCSGQRVRAGGRWWDVKKIAQSSEWDPMMDPEVLARLRALPIDDGSEH